MMNRYAAVVLSLGLGLGLGAAAPVGATVVPLSFTQLTGVAGGTPAGTTVSVADLSLVGFSILSITIADSNSGIGGSAGQFSGFDLDAIKLSLTNCADASCAASAPSLGVFDFSPAGTHFTPGTQRLPVDPKLFGTGVAGNTVDDSIATLGSFDGNNTTLTPFGFVSMGDGGVLTFDLTSAVLPAGMFLYVGEVGGQGEALSAGISVSDTTSVPEPVTLALLGVAFAGMGLMRRRKLN